MRWDSYFNKQNRYPNAFELDTTIKHCNDYFYTAKIAKK